MSILEKFKKSLLPGNYFITKSMELSRITTSGSLWYTKKFLVLYYFIFLSDDLYLTVFKDKIVKIFDDYIESLPEVLRENAKSFFYNNNDLLNFKSENFRLFSDFVKQESFSTESERISYMEMAKKYYFAVLMNSGGQGAAKRKIKEYFSENAFFNMDEIRNVIIQYYGRDVTESKITEQKNDFMAFLRNERQILYYYGFFHSKSSGASDMEFSSLTPIGEIALHSNFYEFLVIWEHQKTKMISQPPIIDINKVNGLSCDTELFDINFSPYFTILKWLKKYGSITKNAYKFIISRTKENIDITDDEMDELMDHLDELELLIKNNGRKQDYNDEDFLKELKKYILGINDALSIDEHLNPMNIVVYNNGVLRINDPDKFDKVFTVYEKLDGYKRNTYQEVLLNSSIEIKKQYKEKVNDIHYNIDKRKKINWDLYAIHPDNFLMYSLIATQISCENNIDINQIASSFETFYDRYSRLLAKLGSKKTDAIKNMKKTLKALRNEEYKDIYVVDEARMDFILTDYVHESSEDLFRKIELESSKETGDYSSERKRNTTLVKLLKSYYTKLDHDSLKCECCSDLAFITEKNGPYIEFHHLIPFSKLDGPDHYLNLYALCPNCHRKIHFIEISRKSDMYDNLDVNNYLRIDLLERLKTLHKDKLLKSYQMEFLLSEDAIDDDGYNYILS